jgi:hypothetical protein
MSKHRRTNSNSSSIQTFISRVHDELIHVKVPPGVKILTNHGYKEVNKIKLEDKFIFGNGSKVVQEDLVATKLATFDCVVLKYKNQDKVNILPKGTFVKSSIGLVAVEDLKVGDKHTFFMSDKENQLSGNVIFFTIESIESKKNVNGFAISITPNSQLCSGWALLSDKYSVVEPTWVVK